MTGPEFVAAPEESPHRRSRPVVPAWARRTILGAIVGALVAGNAYVVRRQFPPVQRQKNAAYDAGLRALDLDRDFPRAEVEFRRFLALDPDHVRVRHLLGVALQSQGKIAEARAEYGRLLERDPDYDDARVALAEIAQGEQAYEEAFHQLDLAKQNDPTPTAVYVLRARMLAAAGDQEGAVAAYRETLRRDPDSYESAVELGDLLMARSVLGGSAADRQAAAAVYHEAEEVLKRRLANTEDKRLRLLLAKSISGQARVLQQRDLGDAVTELRRAAELDPDDPEPTLLLGGFFRSAGNYEEAGRILEDARRKWKKPGVLLALHDLYAAQRRADDATAVLREAVAAWIDDPGLRVRLVGWLVSLSRFEEAEKEADAAQQLFPQDDRVHAARGDLARERAVRAEREGNAREAESRRKEALAAYRRALSLRPKSIRLKKLVAGELIEGLVRRPPGSEMSDDEKFARGCIEDVLRVNGRDAEALAWRSRLLLVDGKFDEVVKSLRPVLDLPAPPLDALRILGTAAARTADMALAADAFARVVEIQRDPDREKAGGGGPSAGDWWNAVHAAREAGRLDISIEKGQAAVRLQPSSVDLRCELGASYLTKGDALAAQKVLRTARNDFPKDLPTRLLLARCYEASGRFDAAESELKEAIVDLPGEQARMAYFEFLARSGRTDLAERGFLAMTASEPDSPAGYLRLGDFYLSLKPPKDEAAMEQYKKALDLTHGGAAPLLRIAELLLGTASRDPGAYAEAEAAVAAFAKAAPNDPWADYLKGKLALAGGRPGEALPLLTSFAAKVPDSSVGQYYLARALREGNRVEDALAAMERAVRLAKSDSSMAVELALMRQDAGMKAMERGDFKSAQQLFASAEAGGAGRGSRLLLSAAHFDAGAVDLSEKECRKVLAEDPNDPRALHLLAMVLIRKGTRDVLDEVEALYRRALDVEPGDLRAKLGIALVLYERGDFRDALAALRAVYPKSDGNGMIAMAIAQCMAFLNDATGAAAFLDDEIKAHPKSGAMHHLKGDFLVYLRQPIDAVREFKTAYELDPEDLSALLAAAAALLQSHEYDEARRLLTEKLPTATEPGFVHLALGETLLMSGRIDEGAEELRRALARLPGHARVLYLLARVSEMGGQMAEAKRLYREAAQRGTVDGDAEARLAQILRGEGDSRGAIDLYAASLKRDPRNVSVLNNMAVLLGEADGRMDEALKAAKNAYALAENRPEIGDTYGWLMFRAGHVKEAADVLETAAHLLKTNAVVQYHAGMALSRAGRVVDARECLERALRIDANFQGAEAARAELEKLR